MTSLGLLKQKGSSRFSWLLAAAFVLTGLLGVSPKRAMAQDEEKPEVLPPLLVVNAAGVDRLLGDVNYMFKTIGREDLNDVINGFLGGVGDLKGLDRKKSMGLMLYLKQGFPPGVDPVGFVPVDNIDALLKTVQLGPVTTKKVPGEENRYEIQGPRQTLHVQLQNGYAYVSNNVEAVDRELPNPATFTQSLTERYDLAASVNIGGVPEGMRTLFLDFLRAQTEADLQQRDNEPEAAYRARKAVGLNNLDNIESILKEGESLTIGVDASQTTKSIVVELEMKAKPSSKFARELKSFPGKPTVFANAYSETIPLAMTGSWNLQKGDKEALSELIKALDAGATEALNNEKLDPEPLQGILKSLQSTVDAGAADFFLQFVGEPPGKFVLVGGLKIDRSGDFASGLEGILRQFKDRKGLAALELNAVKHNGIGIHRVVGEGDGDRGEQRLYGGKPELYVGSGRGALWFAIGKEGVVDQLKASMTQVETVPATPIDIDKIAPFQMVLNLSSWLGLNPDGEGQAMKSAREAFKPNNDQLRITTKTVRDGFRFRMQFDEGFIKFLGLQASNRMDRNQL